MGAKFKSKTHLLSTFFDFWRRFARLASKFEKVLLGQDLKKVFVFKKGIKNAEFHADLKSVEKFLKNAQKAKQSINRLGQPSC
jgi:hypothetical protein